MSSSQTLCTSQPCSICTSCRSVQAHTTITRKVTCFTAVFSADWNSPFNFENHRSRRRRFANGGERISGFTAVFSDDWKDHEEDEDEAPLWVGRTIYPDRSDSLQWEKGLKRKRGAKSYAEPLNTGDLPCKRKCEEPSCSQRTTSTSSPLSPRPRRDQSKESDLKSWSHTQATLGSLITSSVASSDDEETPALSPAVLQHPMASFLGPVDPIDIGTAMWSKVEPELYLSLAAKESQDLSYALQDPASEHPEVTYLTTEPATPENTSFWKDECVIGDQGFDFWDQFIECYIAGEGGGELEQKQHLDDLKDIRLERDFEAFLNS